MEQNMEIDLKLIPECFMHKRQILHICSCGACKIPNPMICGDPECIKAHAHPMQQIVSIGKLQQLLERNTASLTMLVKKTRQYYRQIRESLSHEIQKISDMMAKALLYKHTHPVITLFQQQQHNLISPQKMVQLLSYLRGAKTQRKSMEAIRNEVYEGMQILEKQRKKLIESTQFKKLMLFEMIDVNSTKETMRLEHINTSTLDNEQQFKTIQKMLQTQTKKPVTSWDLLYRASDQQFSANGYRLSIQQRGPFLMIFKTNNDRKFGCFVNCKAEKKEGWLTDGPGFSFIFSLDHDHMFPIRQQAKFRVKAFYIGQKGPQIGCGCDIYISDKCNQNQESGSNFGGSFELPPKLAYGLKQAKQYLAGQENFTISEYQVYEVK